MFTCKLTYRIEGDSEVHSFEVTVESHPEDINDEIWKAMIANDTEYCDKVKIIDISWVEINELLVTEIKEGSTIELPKLSKDEPLDITINLDTVAEEMKNRGVTSIEDGWTNTLMDILEEFYNIETLTRIKMFGE